MIKSPSQLPQEGSPTQRCRLFSPGQAWVASWGLLFLLPQSRLEKISPRLAGNHPYHMRKRQQYGEFNDRSNCCGSPTLCCGGVMNDNHNAPLCEEIVAAWLLFKPICYGCNLFFFLWGCLAEGKWLDFREEKFPCEWGKKNLFIDESRGVWKSTACVPVLFCLRTWMVPYKHTHKVLKSVVKEPKCPQYADFNLLIIQNVDRRVFTAHRLVDFCIHWRHSTHKSLFMAVNLHDKYNQNALSRNRKLEWQLI